MRIFANVHCEGHSRRFEIAVGAGDKTFKWLSLAASQLYAAASPNGALRRRDDYRGATSRAEHHAVNVVLPDDLTPHPAAMLSDYLRDLDTVDITLISEMPVNKNGTPASTNWATLAFTSTEDHNSVLFDEEAADEKNAPMDTEEASVLKAKAEFMRIVMRSQMLNTKRRAHEVKTIISKAESLMPRLKELDSLDVQEVLFEDWDVISEAFSLYAPHGSMDLQEFQRLCDHAGIFSAKDTDMLSSRAFNKTLKISGSKNALEWSSGTFIAALLMLSQIRHNDIYEKDSAVVSPAGYLKEILSKNFRVLAQRLSFKCLPKEMLCSTEFLHRLRDVYDDLVAMFEKYAARHNRDIYTSLPHGHVGELLFEARLADSVDVDRAKALFKRVKSGPINGREDLQPPHPDDEYLFPELVEAGLLCQYDNAVAIMNGKKPLISTPTTAAAGSRNQAKQAKNVPAIPAHLDLPAEEEEAEDPSSAYPELPSEMTVPVDILNAFTVALQKMAAALHYVPEEQTKKRSYQ